MRKESLRFVICARPACAQVFFLCRRCDRGNRYCSPGCSTSARRSGLRAAGERYQRTSYGRRGHADRQRRYRARRAAAQIVTHQGTPTTGPIGKVGMEATEAATVAALPIDAKETGDASDLDGDLPRTGDDTDPGAGRGGDDAAQGADATLAA